MDDGATHTGETSDQGALTDRERVRLPLLTKICRHYAATRYPQTAAVCQ